jgi:hypothetical protein
LLVTTMNTASFLSTLRAHGRRPLVFQAGADVVAPGYHLTEVKEVAYRTMDCGAATHRWTENHFEVWVPASAEDADGRGHMAADKFLRIVDRVQQDLPLQGEAEAKVFAGIGAHPAAVFSVAAIERHGDRLVVSLEADQPRCKARERQARAGQGCGCGAKTEATAPATACCA